MYIYIYVKISLFESARNTQNCLKWKLKSISPIFFGQWCPPKCASDQSITPRESYEVPVWPYYTSMTSHYIHRKWDVNPMISSISHVVEPHFFEADDALSLPTLRGTDAAAPADASPAEPAFAGSGQLGESSSRSARGGRGWSGDRWMGKIIPVMDTLW